MNNKIFKDDIKTIIDTKLDWKRLKGKTVLVAGANGFIAGYITEVLLALKEVKVIALVRDIEKAKNKFSQHSNNKNLSIIQQDISKSFDIDDDIDYIIHAASQASPHFYSTDPVGTLSANVFGTANLLEIGVRKNITKFLYLSSGAVYGTLDEEGKPVDETYPGKVDITNIRSCYDESKRMGENMCVCYSYQYGIPVNMVRISYAYGPGMELNDSRIFPTIINSIINNKDIEINSDGSARRNFCYITDLIKAIFLILFEGENAQAYNVASEKDTSILELANVFVELMPGKKLKVKCGNDYKFIKTKTSHGNFNTRKLLSLWDSSQRGGGLDYSPAAQRMLQNFTESDAGRNIVILGANSNIAKALTYSFSNNKDINLALYTTNISKTKNFTEQLQSKNITVFDGYQKGIIQGADLIINCIGVGTPKDLNEDYTPWFTVLEEFDNLCIQYVKDNPNSVYISFSSGTVYGKDFSKPVNNSTQTVLDVNKIDIDNFYTIAKIYSEAKHRAYKDLNIIDLRIFSFFSRFSNLNDGYLMSDAALSILNKTTLYTDSNDIIRDYIHISDLSDLILGCAGKKLNTAIDVRSKQPAAKFQILEMLNKNFGLEYKIKTDLKFINSAGTKNAYYSERNTSEKLLNFFPQYTSLESIKKEIEYLIPNKH